MANGSFYQNGLPISSAETGLGNVAPGAPVPNKASSSFYLNGTVYQTLENQDALLALLLADTNLVAADLVAANIAANNAANSATAATATLASAMLKANNLSDVASVSQAKINLSLVKADVGLGNVDNTSDVNKPVSTAQATADALVASNAAAATALKANIASPALTGTPSAPTAAALDNSTRIATTAYADAAVSTLSGTVNTALALKAPLASPALTGVPTSTTAAVNTNTTQVATTAFVLAQAGAANPLMNGAVAVGTATKFAREDHVHPTDTSLAPLASPALSGVPTAPTATVGTNTTQIATTAFVLANGSGSGALRYDTAQALTSTNLTQARANLAQRETNFTGTIVESHAGNAVTFAVKTVAGADATATSPIRFTVPNGSGGFSDLWITAALSITVPSTATLGTANGTPFRLWLALFDDAGTTRLAVRNNVSSTSATSGIDAPAEWLAASTTLTPGNLAQTTYTTGAAVTSKFFCWIGFATYESGQVTAGTWLLSPTTISLVTPSTPRPGAVVRTVINRSVVSPSISTTTLTDSTLTYSWNSLSGADLVEVSVEGNIYLRNGVANGQGTGFIRRDAVTLDNNATHYIAAVSDSIAPFHMKVLDYPSTTSTVVYKFSYQNAVAGLIQYNASNLMMKELMA